MSRKWRLIFPVSTGLLIVFIGFLGAKNVQAAPLTYNSDFTVSLTSPAINFTIKSGSVADSLVVNATSVVATLSSSTGGSFTLTSASRDLSISTSSSGGTVTLSCNSGVASTTITQSSASTSYTIAPTASQCVVPSSPSPTPTPSGGGGGGGGGTGYYLPAPPPPSITTSSVATSTSVTSTFSNLSPQDQLNALLATLQSLMAQARQQGISLPPQAQQYAKPSQKFTRNLSFGSKGDDVMSLQLFLIAQNSGPYAQKLAAVGANGRFGPLTKNALKEFQKSVGIAPASGYFGPKTRAYINSSIQ